MGRGRVPRGRVEEEALERGGAGAAEQWCPMPQATWHFRLVKLSGPAGPIRFDYVVAAPPAGSYG